MFELICQKIYMYMKDKNENNIKKLNDNIITN